MRIRLAMAIPFAANLGRVLGALGALALLVDCGGAATSMVPTGSGSRNTLTQFNFSQSFPQELSSAAIAPHFVVHSWSSKSWIDSHAEGPLLYVSDSELNVVFVLTWPKLRLIGNLSRLHTPQGECVNRSGDIWITNTTSSDVLEFGHASTTLIKTLPDTGEYPVSCAIGPNGDLAVTNIVSRAGRGKYGPGSLSIYKGATGSPHLFRVPAMHRVYFDGYDSRGNLFLDGENRSGAFAIAEFDGKKFIPLTISGATIYAPGAVQVTGSYVNVGDQEGSSGNSVMYQTTQSKTTLTVDATAQLVGGSDCVGSYIYGTATKQRLICPNEGSAPSVNVYAYPAGGNPIRALYHDIYQPNSAVISP